MAVAPHRPHQRLAGSAPNRGWLRCPLQAGPWEVPARDEEVLVSSIDPESGVVLTKWVASVAWLGVEHDDIDGSDAAQVDFPIDFHADQEWMAWKDRYINDQWFFVLEIVDEDRHRLRVRRNL